MKILGKKKQANPTQIDTKTEFRDYYDLINHRNFISFDALMNLTLLVSSQKAKSSMKEKYQKKVIDSYKSTTELVFKNFVISWQRSSRFGSKGLVPIIAQVESSNVRASNFYSDSSDSRFSALLGNLNTLAWDFIANKSRFVEVVEGCIVFLDPQTKTLKVIFSEVSLASSLEDQKEPNKKG
ncbi:DUF2714 domain-containing protein [Mesomycoplasma ovipneumoniae]|uniref:DUF2714 domain-containing protein n=1 Tax=Mesomycoplasma ovipneumoniae TaxID=29562 RepID=UPI0026E17903|nr:DUF2714 domain-containing protein [Mesomycoplasma ovipneumoniae]MDO6826351.1 DUF2714 domain-containing protein [Mesomycoplasma ovipneumoniae]MDO6857480.1 DUF2714 domain-containing protein [Mesomycoplasma ovipneumoniae]MDW2923847.1 DUF2714 domain-containing protein [Mesomycoplasma ovipneumoniae]MDW2930910.1 DUF2714 domain-containing protein [Mesomycoplasma ovipneumoniae]WNM16230.1 DUF2714 domain-containing protein [Mesomycoplasma ovipneumoniae]